MWLNLQIQYDLSITRNKNWNDAKLGLDHFKQITLKRVRDIATINEM